MPAGDRQAISTRAPRSASRLAAARPRPEFAPVIRTVRPVWSGMSFALHCGMAHIYARMTVRRKCHHLT